MIGWPHLPTLHPAARPSFPKHCVLLSAQKVSRLPQIEYKMNIRKSVAFLYTNNKLSERETKKTIPFTIARRKKNKVPRNKFNHEGKRPVLGKQQDIEE